MFCLCKVINFIQHFHSYRWNHVLVPSLNTRCIRLMKVINFACPDELFRNGRFKKLILHFSGYTVNLTFHSLTSLGMTNVCLLLINKISFFLFSHSFTHRLLPPSTLMPTFYVYIMNCREIRNYFEALC